MKHILISFLVLTLNACYIGPGGICGPETPKFYCLSKEEQEKLRPKAYGEYWTKPGMTKESWQHDWVACGGMANGGYVNDAPQGSSTAVIRAASDQRADELATCMQAKGYEYHYTGP